MRKQRESCLSIPCVVVRPCAAGAAGSVFVPLLTNTMDRQQQTEQEGFQLRRAAINELNFVYRKLQRLFSALIRRGEPGKLGNLLKRQQQEDQAIKNQLAHVAMEQGQPPGPCVCEEPNALVEEVYHTDRVRYANRSGPRALLTALKRVRVFLMRTWGRWLSALPENVLPAYRRKIADLQNREAEQHRELVALEHELATGHDGPMHGRMTG